MRQAMIGTTKHESVDHLIFRLHPILLCQLLLSQLFKGSPQQKKRSFLGRFLPNVHPENRRGLPYKQNFIKTRQSKLCEFVIILMVGEVA